MKDKINYFPGDDLKVNEGMMNEKRVGMYEWYIGNYIFEWTKKGKYKRKKGSGLINIKKKTLAKIYNIL